MITLEELCFHLNAVSRGKKEDGEMEFILESINLRFDPEVLLKFFRCSSGEAVALTPEQVGQLPKAQHSLKAGYITFGRRLKHQAEMV